MRNLNSIINDNLDEIFKKIIPFLQKDNGDRTDSLRFSDNIHDDDYKEFADISRFIPQVEVLNLIFSLRSAAPMLNKYEFLSVPLNKAEIKHFGVYLDFLDNLNYLETELLKSCFFVLLPKNLGIPGYIEIMEIFHTVIKANSEKIKEIITSQKTTEEKIVELEKLVKNIILATFPKINASFEIDLKDVVIYTEIFSALIILLPKLKGEMSAEIGIESLKKLIRLIARCGDKNYYNLAIDLLNHHPGCHEKESALTEIQSSRKALRSLTNKTESKAEVTTSDKSRSLSLSAPSGKPLGAIQKTTETQAKTDIEPPEQSHTSLTL